MKKTANLKIALMVSILLPVVLSGSALAEGTYSGGTGQPNDPYLIATAADMNEIGAHPNDWDEYFLMTADVNMFGYSYTTAVIAPDISDSNEDFDGIPFTGEFDGNDHKIINLTIDTQGCDKDNLGLFGYVAAGAVITNTGLENATIIGSGNQVYLEFTGGFGGLVGANSGVIENCWVDGSVTGGNYSEDFGGLCGWNKSTGSITYCYVIGSVGGGVNAGGLGGLCGSNDGSITNCWAGSSVTGKNSLGGLVGYNDDGTISNCYATGFVTGTDDDIGGLVGGIDNGAISNCYATGSVSGYDRVGGLAGWNEGTVSSCYATGFVSGTSSVGGLVGYGSSTSISSSYWDIQTSGQSVSVGGSGKTTIDMKTMNTFFHWACTPAVWTIDDTNDYPHLAWENSPGTPINSPLLTDFITGSGTEQEPYLIYTPNDLDTVGLFANEWDKHFKLMADIDLSGWSPTEPNIIVLFTGVFDGNGHAISYFTWNPTYPKGTVYVGLFGRVDSPNAEIKDLRLIDPNVHGDEYVGALVGRLRDGKITSCGIEGGVIFGEDGVGGLAGENDSGDISNCYATGSVTGIDLMSDDVGGLVGCSENGIISNCYATGSVLGIWNVGGLVGWNDRSTISNCYATSSVSGTDHVGGLAGCNFDYGIISDSYANGSVTGDSFVSGLAGSNFGIISDSYATSSVTGVHYVGGLVGYNHDNTISNCYAAGFVLGTTSVGGLVGWNNWGSDIFSSFWDTQTTGQVNGVGTHGGGTTAEVYGRTTAQMQTESTFTDYGWDFVGESTNGPNDIWRMCVDGVNYPKLWWEFGIGDFACGNGVNFIDFAVLADTWMLSSGETGYNDKCDLVDNDTIDFADLAIFSNHWLEGVE